MDCELRSSWKKFWYTDHMDVERAEPLFNSEIYNWKVIRETIPFLQF